jgi:PleD family two-component response regulator
MVLCAVDDLMFTSKLRAAARGAAVELKFVRSPDALLSEGRTTPPALVIIDLNADRLRPLEMIAAIRADATLAGTRVVGFVSHVDAERVAGARAAGADDVLARSAFVTLLPALLRDRQ